MDVGEGKMEMVDEGGGEGAGDAHWRSGSGGRRRWKRWMLERWRWWMKEMEKRQEMDIGKVEMMEGSDGKEAGDGCWKGRGGNGVRRRWKRWMLERKRWKLWREEMEKVDVGKVKMVDEGDGEEPGDGCWRGGNGGKRR